MSLLQICFAVFCVSFIVMIGMVFIKKNNTIAINMYKASKISSVLFFVLSLATLYMDLYNAFSNVHIR